MPKTSCQVSLLNIAMWNIEGLTNCNILDNYFSSILSDFHIIGFVETWLDNFNLDINIPGFDFITGKTRRKNKKARRNSGGISIYAKRAIAKGIYKLKSNHTDICWIRLDHTYFQLSRDIYLAIVYVSPESVSCNKDDIDAVYKLLLDDIVKYSRLGDIVIQGDFNAYTNKLPDFVLHDESNHSHNEDFYYKYDNSLPRNNQNPKRANNSGRNLLNLCKESGLRILNGRSTCDLLGKPTCITYNGCSAVDYTIVSNDLLSSVGFFKVSEFTALSNHCPIVCGLMSDCKSELHCSSKLSELPGKYIWTEHSILSFKENLQSRPIKGKINNFLNKDFSDVNDIVKDFNSILTETADMSTKFVKKVNFSRGKYVKNNKKPWFSESCLELKNMVKMYEKLVNKCPFNVECRQRFYSYRSRYRRKCRYEEKLYRKRIFSELNESIDSNPKTFWKLINKLDQSSKCIVN